MSFLPWFIQQGPTGWANSHSKCRNSPCGSDQLKPSLESPSLEAAISDCEEGKEGGFAAQPTHSWTLLCQVEQNLTLDAKAAAGTVCEHLTVPPWLQRAAEHPERANRAFGVSCDPHRDPQSSNVLEHGHSSELTQVRAA